MDDIQNIIRALITVLALALFIISLTAYWRTKNLRVGFICAAFFIFFLKGLLLSMGLLWEEWAEFYADGVGELFDLGIVAMLALAILKK